MNAEKMDKRKKRTSYHQYVIYLKVLEEDHIFRTGIIPRDVELNYLAKKWEELADRLNTCGHGPVMSADEWKKRLNDWKNSTRAKFRKCQSDQYKNSDKGELSLTPLEERALLLWGPLSTKSLSNVSTEQSTTFILPEQTDLKSTEIISIKTDNSNEIIIEPVQIQTAASIPTTATVTTIQHHEAAHRLTDSPIQTINVSEHDDEPRSAKRKWQCNDDDQTFGMLKLRPTLSSTDAQSIAVELRRIAEIKEEKLKFEIARFKFKNPGFEYNYSPSSSNEQGGDFHN